MGAELYIFLLYLKEHLRTTYVIETLMFELIYLYRYRNSVADTRHPLTIDMVYFNIIYNGTPSVVQIIHVMYTTHVVQITHVV